MGNDVSTANEDDNDYDRHLSRIRTGLQTARSDAAGSIASYAMDLRLDIREARGRGLSFRQIAEIFTANGVPAEPDAIRVALGRNVVTKAARGRRMTEKLGSTSDDSNKSRSDGAAIVLRVK